MKTYLVEVWTDGKSYDAGQAGEYIKVRANDASHAESKAGRYEVVVCIGVATRARKVREG